jgi:hypothetical protein
MGRLVEWLRLVGGGGVCRRGQFQLGGKSKPKKTKLPAVYDAKVDPAKVNLPALKAWGMRRLVELMGSEDEVQGAEQPQMHKRRNE